MRTPAAMLVIGVAAVLGAATGAFVLPDRKIVVAGDHPSSTSATPPAASSSRPTATSPSALPSPSSSKSASPSPPASPTSTAGGQGPVSSANMLTTADFREVGLTVTAQRSDVRLELVGCDRKETLDDVASSGPPVQRSWEAVSVVADEQAIAARDAEEATQVARRVLRKLEACQQRPPKYWVYGPTHTARLRPATTASWLGTVDGELNTTGRAPKGEKINGGIAVLRSGVHVAVFYITWCAGYGESPACVVAGGNAYEQLAALSRRAALRLG